jgi:hypothetical protein
MALEPTEEQDLAVRMAVQRQLFSASRSTKPVWDLIRDMVLEAAAQVCDRMHEGGGYSDEAYVCAEHIRALKGKP